MRNEYAADGALAMTRGSVLRIEDGRGFLVHVREGSVWLTQEGDRQDRYLEAGASFRLDRDGVAIAQAMSRSTISLTAPKKAPSFWARLFAPHARPTTAAL
jgi:Protein of unknown function (DUF2917)